ncbi:hypothetical protein ACQP1P_33125 [Dactylosporangium sp. CA-052675]|uniref:hypothetical protein n=1 Tax=Dactylosporangium sp. CA-052675 TaxID=3239927 RepID=UPI003D908669
MADPIVLAQVRLQPHHQPTGVTRHYFGNPSGARVEVPRPVSLQVVQYPGDEPRAYLFYCDESGGEMTDTYHDSVQEAFEQASAEFGVLHHEWARRSHNA